MKSSVNLNVFFEVSDIFLCLFLFMCSGTFSFNEVMNLGGQSEKQDLDSIQRTLQFDDAINIQFTSVCDYKTYWH